MTATISPANATDKGITWTSSNLSVASVNPQGEVTALGAGTTTITATTSDGGKTATLNVTVSSDINANDLARAETVSAILANGTLTVDSPNAETINVFSISGALVNTFTKNAGKEIRVVSHLSGGIYVVTGSAGWSAKVVKK